MNNTPNQNQDTYFQSSEDLLPHLFAYKDSNNNTNLEKVKQSLSHMDCVSLDQEEGQLLQAINELESKGLISYHSPSKEITLLDKASEDRQKVNQAFLTDVLEKSETLKSSFIPQENASESKNKEKIEEIGEIEGVEEVKEDFELTSRKILDLLGKRLASHSKQKLVRAIQKVTGKRGKSAGTYITIMLKRKDISRSETGKYFILKDSKKVIKKPTEKIVSKVEPKPEPKLVPTESNELPSDIVDLERLEVYSTQLEERVASLEEELRITKEKLEKTKTILKVCVK